MTTTEKFWHILTPGQRRAAIVLLGMMLIGMILETLGIGLVIPALALMTQSDLAARYPMLAPVLNSLGNPSQEHLVVFGMLGLVVVYAIKTLFLALLATRQLRYVYGLRADISQRLYAGYLRQPYAFHLQRNSAQLVQNVVTETNLFTVTGVIAGFYLITELLVLLGISTLLLAIEPVGALVVVSTLGLAGWGFSRITRNRILRWGEERQLHEGLRIQHLQQGLGGVKDVKLLGREADFLAEYWVHNSGSARVSQREHAMQMLPKLLLELLAVAGLAALVIVMISRGKPVGTLLPTLGLFAAAAFRIMPSVNRVLLAIQGVRYTLPVIDTLYSDLRMLDNTPLPKEAGVPIPFNHALSLDHVTFHYSSSDRQALRNISLSIQRGASVGFVGGSGAGKSTLVDIILGLLSPVSGSVKVDGIDIQANLRGWQDQIGYVPQSIFLTDDTLRRNVAFGIPAGEIDEAAVERAIRAAQLDRFISDLPKGLDTMVGERGVRLSGGQRQRIGIARALYHDPQVLVLDEATSSLDTATEHEVMEAVRSLQGEKTIIIVAHRLSTVEHCDYLYRLEQGEVVEEGMAAAVLGKLAGSVNS